MKRFFAYFIACAACFLPEGVFAAPSVTFNGVDFSGVTQQKFTNVNVEFDAGGNIIMTAPQYKIATPGSDTIPSLTAAQSPVTAALPNDANPVYLLALFNAPGLLGYNIDVYVNGKFAKTITQGQPQQSFDLTPYLAKGANTIQYRMVMAADSGTSSRATVNLSITKATKTSGNTVELTGEFAPIEIKGIDGAKSYTIVLNVP